MKMSDDRRPIAQVYKWSGKIWDIYDDFKMKKSIGFRGLYKNISAP